MSRFPRGGHDRSTTRGFRMGSNSRYDRARPVDDREAAEARALHVIAGLVEDYPGIPSREVAGQVAHVLHAAAIELDAGRPVPVGVRRAVRALADALRRDMQPRD
jgi:hypothetical protein